MNELIQEDLISFAYDLQKVAIYHRAPLTVEVRGLEPITVGEGLGGFSWTIFQRGEDCTACGLCCHLCRRRTWWWHESDPRPDGVGVPIDVKINGLQTTFFYHMTSSGKRFEKCDFLIPAYTVEGSNRGQGQLGSDLHLDNDPNRLVDIHGNPMWFCSIQFKGKPLHCKSDPFLSVHKVRTARGVVNLLSRRLPSRNWRWPKCPIDVANEPFTPEIAQLDLENFQQLYNSFGNLPGSQMIEGLQIWEAEASKALEGHAPSENIFFADVFSRVE